MKPKTQISFLIFSIIFCVLVVVPDVQALKTRKTNTLDTQTTYTSSTDSKNELLDTGTLKDTTTHSLDSGTVKDTTGIATTDADPGKTGTHGTVPTDGGGCDGEGFVGWRPANYPAGGQVMCTSNCESCLVTEYYYDCDGGTMSGANYEADPSSCTFDCTCGCNRDECISDVDEPQDGGISTDTPTL